MKIAVLLDDFPRLTLTFVVNQIVALIDKGHKIDIFSFVHLKTKVIHNIVNKYHLIEKTYFLNFPQNLLWRFLKFIWLFILNFPKDPYNIIRSLDSRRFGHDALSLKLFYAYVGFRNRKNKYDIIHAHFGPSGNIAVKLKDLGIKGRIVVSFHGYDFSQYVRKRGKGIYSYLFKKATDAITANSNYAIQRLEEIGCAHEKIIRLPEAFVVKDFPFKERIFKRGEKIRILTIARLVEKKGHYFSIKAVCKVLKKYSNLIYTIIGDGPLKEQLEHLIVRLRCEKKIFIISGKEQSEIIEAYNKSHIFILPSVTARDGDTEGQGLVLQEAQASGLPVIVTDHNGLPEGVLDRKSGFIVPEKDVDAIAEKLEYLIKYPYLWPEMGRCGRRFVEGKYDIEIIIKRLIDIYSDVLNKQ